jgi:hypothetical protein
VRKSVFIPQKSSRALSKSSLNPGAPYQRRLPSILRMRAENGLVRVFRRGVLEQQALRHPPGPFPLTWDADVRQRPAALPPPAAGPIAVRFPKTGKWGAMASDITLAVGDGARHMTYDELAQARGIPLVSARIAPRAISRNSAETPDFSDPGPAEAVSYGTRPMPAAGGLEPGPGTTPTPVANGPGQTRYRR